MFRRALICAAVPGKIERWTKVIKTAGIKPE
jgi:hypothetical protein